MHSAVWGDKHTRDMNLMFFSQMQFLQLTLGIIKPSDIDIIEVTDCVVRDISNACWLMVSF